MIPDENGFLATRKQREMNDMDKMQRVPVEQSCVTPHPKERTASVPVLELGLNLHHLCVFIHQSLISLLDPV
jgi:hypothetical protein